MESWNDYKESITSISEEEKLQIELLADITTARLEKGMTQRQLENITGLKQSAIARLESPSNDVSPNLSTIIKYLNALGMKLIVIKKE